MSAKCAIPLKLPADTSTDPPDTATPCFLLLLRPSCFPPLHHHSFFCTLHKLLRASKEGICGHGNVEDEETETAPETAEREGLPFELRGYRHPPAAG